MEHPFANQPEITTLDTVSTEKVSGASVGGKAAVPVPRGPVELRPPVYSTLAIGEEGGVFPEPEDH